MSGRRFKPKKTREQKLVIRKAAEEDLAKLQERIDAFDPEDLAALADINSFEDLPLSHNSIQGLKAAHFTKLTDIQKRAIPLILKGRDVLGAARTGSGKTLAFLVPMLEHLFRSNWTQYDGLGALVISPTRELALQIFEVLRKIGRTHGFSAGLVIGGKDLKEEADRMLKMNILVCTPGRILQHMDQTAGFQADNLQMLILDEADRILDMGFRKTLDAIVDNLPPSRQTLLFSATQTKSVKDLARLSLKNPEYVSVHESSDSATPASLQQSYVLVNLPEKLDTLYAFMKTHLKCKAIVFMSTGKQVRFAYETFRHLHPGVPLIHLHGKQKQMSRAEITARFAASKHCYLFCTDIVARGLDFPSVDWVIQLDVPEDADTYIHRVGRTARYEKGGKALLMLLPSEEGAFLARLKKRKVVVDKLNIKQNKKQSIVSQLQHMCFKDPEIKYLGQKAFVSYVRSVNLHKDKDVFKVDQLPVEEFAASLGLPGAPRIKFLSSKEVKAKKNATLKPESESEGGSEGSGPDTESGSESDTASEAPASKTEAPKKVTKTKYDRMFERRNQDILSEHYTKLVEHDGTTTIDQETADADEDDAFMKIKRADHALEAGEGNEGPQLALAGDAPSETFKPDSKRKAKEALSKKAMLKYKPLGTKLVFDDEGDAHPMYEMQTEEAFRALGPSQQQIDEFLKKQGELLQSVDVDDKVEAKDKKRDKRRKQLERAKQLAEEAASDDSDQEVVLAPYSDDDGSADAASMDEEVGGKRKKWFQEYDDKAEEEAASKRRKLGNVVEVAEPQTLAAQEELALQLLGRS
ncbi:P-loop containing nucleoside triphosphate hydrolase protein [Protomyces lactucae-debilis]|uniref:ATP-dependent RNA helicase n=1 Tax=Protomyces lactucae-debilis TaxID=2754530 RepID=A0A1Y2FBS9_PROLT|nr:P-loop containing nucleoside triphosphate hydrolase protein [Protomyces lactucae-debilis]ORY81372.1 P-loop containing nucleoside triphosphate hydrolase protein [Protomyces lactucae-debilis]